MEQSSPDPRDQNDSEPVLVPSDIRAESIEVAQSPENEHRPLASEIRERHPDWPELEFSVILQSHFGRSPHDNDTTDEALLSGKVDIYIPEEAGWKTSHIDSVTRRVDQLLASSDKRLPKPIIAVIDIPYDHPLAVAAQNHVPLDAVRAQGNAIRRAPSFAEAINLNAKSNREFADLQRQREEYMISQIEPAIEQVLIDNSSRMPKPALNILLSIGATHTTLVSRLREEGFSIESRFAAGHTRFTYDNELNLTYMQGLEPSEELLAAAWLDRAYIFPFITDAIKGELPTPIMAELERSIVDQFSVAEIEDVFERTHTIEKNADVLFAMLKDKAIIIGDDGVNFRFNESLLRSTKS